MNKKKLPEKMRINVLKRDDYRCLWCGRGRVDGVNLDVDHIIAEAWGGMTTEDNLGTLCSHCNRAKGSDYFGSYLLSTLFKVENIESWFINKDLGTNFNPETNQHHDGVFHIWKISFFDKRNGFIEHTIKHYYLIPNQWLCATGAETEIKIAEREKEALLSFKDKLIDFLFENRGYLEVIDGKLVFREIL